MFTGRYYHTVEAKGRVSLPKSFRKKQRSWVVTRGLDGGLFLFPEANFQTQLKKLTQRTFTKKRDRDFIRYMTNDAYQVESDNNGRVLLPEYLKQFASLSQKVVIVGSFEYIEIWDVTKYHTYIDKVEKDAAQIAEQLDTHSGDVGKSD